MASSLDSKAQVRGCCQNGGSCPLTGVYPEGAIQSRCNLKCHVLRQAGQNSAQTMQDARNVRKTHRNM